jgi:chaperonin GroES
MNLKPLCERVICERIPAESVLASGIILPNVAQKKTQMATVIACGPGDPDEFGTPTPMDVKPGDKILFGEHSGQVMKHEGRELFVIRNRDIFAVVED